MKILGFTESVNTCDCCGKQGLKGTYAVTIDGDISYFGSTCVKNKNGFDSSKTIKEQVNQSKIEEKIRFNDFYQKLGGFELSEKMSAMEAFTPEHDKLYAQHEIIRDEARRRSKIIF